MFLESPQLLVEISQVGLLSVSRRLPVEILGLEFRMKHGFQRLLQRHAVEHQVHTADLIRRFEQQAVETVEKMGQSARSQGIEVETAVRTGDIDDEMKVSILNIHGKGMVARAMMGSTAERVIRAVSCPVLAIPAKLE